MKKGWIFLFILLLVCSSLVFPGCDGQKEQNEDRITMYVGLGNTGGTYYEKLHDLILEETGLDVLLVYSNTLDTTNAINDCINAGDLPADIIITANALSKNTSRSALLDLASYTNLTDSFRSTVLTDLSYGGAIYQLPFSTRLIGIEYNKTLFEEMGYEVPNTFDEMVALKARAEEDGFVFAVSGGVATGHGFNYLMYLTGTNYFSTPDGSKWLKSFLGGEESVAAFEEAALYFKKYADAGLFGYYNSENWLSSSKFCRTRALFYYNITDDAYSYYGFRYNLDGTLYGVTYLEDGSIQGLSENPEGNAVLLNDQYVAYDPENEAHKGLTRYQIPGAVVLSDQYATMPYISENGTTNCFTYYNNMYIALNGALADDTEKLKKVSEVLTFMTGEKAIQLFTDLYPDGYVGTTDFTVDSSRLYYDYADTVKTGYLMPWYYNNFSTDTIVHVGQLVNDYLKGENPPDFEEIPDSLDYWNKQSFLPEGADTVTVRSTFSYEETAALEAAAAAISMQQVLDEAGMNATLTVSLMPYVQSLTELPTGKSCGVVQQRLHEGSFSYSKISSLINPKCNTVVAIRMTGAEIKALCKNKYSILTDFGKDSSFSYTCLLKEGTTLSDRKTYFVAVPKDSLEASVYKEYLQQDKVLTQKGAALNGTVQDGLETILTGLSSIGPEDILW